MKKYYGSRKFLLTCLTLLITLVLLITNRITDVIFADMVKWVLGLYFAGNVGEGVSTLINGKITPANGSQGPKTGI